MNSFQCIGSLSFLESSKFVHLDDKTRTVAKNLVSKGLQETLANISRHVVTLISRPDLTPELFGKRNSSQILKEGFVVSNMDQVLAFLGLSRASNIPAAYIEAITEQPAEDLTSLMMPFIDVFAGEWVKYDLFTGFNHSKVYRRWNKDFIELGRGLDHTSIYSKQGFFYYGPPRELRRDPRTPLYIQMAQRAHMTSHISTETLKKIDVKSKRT